MIIILKNYILTSTYFSENGNNYRQQRLGLYTTSSVQTSNR